MEDFKAIATDLFTDFRGFGYVVTKITEDSEGYRAGTTHYFNDIEKAYDKFFTIVERESDMLQSRYNRAGYDTDNIIEIEAMNTDEILDTYGTYDTESGNIITQVLILKNPEV